MVTKDLTYDHNRWYLLRLEITGSSATAGVRLRGYVDGNLDLKYFDDDTYGPFLDAGRIGVWEFETYARYDDVKVFDLRGNPRLAVASRKEAGVPNPERRER